MQDEAKWAMKNVTEKLAAEQRLKALED